MSNYAKIKNYDIANGDGIGISIFVTGCEFCCKGCFNQNIWGFDKGKTINETVINNIVEMCSNTHINHLSILGGEPLHENNINNVTNIISRVKEQLPNKKIWVWTGYLFEDLLKKYIGVDGISMCLKIIFNHIDYLVDGQYDEKLYDQNLKWKGSSNQRVIDIKETHKQNKIVLYDK